MNTINYMLLRVLVMFKEYSPCLMQVRVFSQTPYFQLCSHSLRFQPHVLIVC